MQGFYFHRKRIHQICLKQFYCHTKQFQRLEEKIAALNKKKSELEVVLADPGTYSDKQKFLETETAYKQTEAELAGINSEYGKTFEKLVKLESSDGV